MRPIKMLENTMVRRVYMIAIAPVVFIAVILQAIVVGAVKFAYSLAEPCVTVADIYKDSWSPREPPAQEADEDYWNHI